MLIKEGTQLQGSPCSLRTTAMATGLIYIRSNKERTSSYDIVPLITILAEQHSHPKLRSSRYPVHEVTFSAHKGVAPNGGSYQTTSPMGSGHTGSGLVHLAGSTATARTTAPSLPSGSGLFSGWLPSCTSMRLGLIQWAHRDQAPRGAGLGSNGEESELNGTHSPASGR